jgi:pyruvate,water dikinase
MQHALLPGRLADPVEQKGSGTMDRKEPVDKLLLSLQERAKELQCLYRVEEILSDPDRSLDEVCPEIIDAIPPGWQFPDICQAQITIDERAYSSPNLIKTSWVQSGELVVQNVVVGTIHVYYTEEVPAADIGPFLQEEARLIRTIAERLSAFIVHQRMKDILEGLENLRVGSPEDRRGEWRAILELLQRTDRNLFMRISEKMLCHLCWRGIPEARNLYRSCIADQPETPDETSVDALRVPHHQQPLSFLSDFSAATFRIAAQRLTDREILELIQRWIQEDKLSVLAQVVNRNLSLSQVADAVRRFQAGAPDECDLSSSSRRGIKVSLIRRILSDQLDFVNIAKDFIDIADFHHLLQYTIFSADSQGSLGGKGAAMFLANRILDAESEHTDLLKQLRVPRTWYVTTDGLLHYIRYQGLDHLVEQKYKDIGQVQLEYPHVIRLFKGGRFPAEIIQGLAMALDDLGDRPIVVRSSSLLEDRLSVRFTGKYKSLFLVNEGSKPRRLNALMDAIAEVYAATFSPQAVKARAEEGLLDFEEEMGIIIQEVIGTRVDKYFLPTFAGVAFSENELSWFSHLKRRDGLIQLVPGLGTRLRMLPNGDYPVMIAPGSPNMRVSTNDADILRYSPKKLEVFNLEANSIETLELEEFLRLYGHKVPGIGNVVSVIEGGKLKKTGDSSIDFRTDKLAATFEGMLTHEPVAVLLKRVVKVLEDRLRVPVQVDFASDGNRVYLLKCRQQHSDYHTQKL